jgi:Tfp pilus assembly protein PilF
MRAASKKKRSEPVHHSNARVVVDKRERQRTRRRVNFPLLGISIGLLGCLSAVGYFWHQRQEAALRVALTQRAQALAEEKDWHSAFGYWQRSLWLSPNDFDARLNLIYAFEHCIVSPRDRRRLSLMLHEAVGLAPDRKSALSLQVRVAENLLEMGDYREAYAAADSLLNPESTEAGVDENSDEAVKLRRVLALAGSVLAGADRDVETTGEAAERARKRGDDVKEAAKNLAASVADFPDDIRLAVAAANFYQQNASDLGISDPRGRADAFMNSLVDARTDDAESHIARYVYRKRYGVSGADDDLSAVLKLDPKHFQGLILKAGATANQDLDAARGMLRTAIETKPADNRGYVALAQLESAAGNWDAAADVLQEARDAIGAQDLWVNKMLTYVLIKSSQLTQAERSLTDLESGLQSQLAELSIVSRRSLHDQIMLLRAQLADARGDLHGAAVSLKAIVASSEQAPTGQTTPVEAKELLASVMERLGYWELAAGYWMDLAKIPSRTGEATRRAAAALLAIGQWDRTIQLTNQYMHPPLTPSGAPAWVPVPEVCLLTLNATLQKQLSLPSNDRNWTEFENALALSKKLTPSRVEACIAEFEYQRSFSDDDASDKAKQVLAAGEQEFANNVRFWTTAAFGYQTLELQDDAQRAVDKFDALETNPARRAAFHAIMASRSDDVDAADNILSSAVATAKNEDRGGLQALRVSLLLGAGSADRALKVAKEIITPKEADARLLILGVEAALGSKDFQAAQEWELLLAAANPSDDFTPRFYRARRLLDQFESLSANERDQAKQLITEVRAARPNWGDAITLAARLADLTGNRQQAIEDFQLGISLGSKSPAVMERLVALLYAEGRYDLAETYLSRLSAGSRSTPEMESLAIATALRRNQVSEAIDLARKAVEGHPEDPVRQIWLANLLAQDAMARSSSPDEAEQALRVSLTRFPDDVRVWSALLNLLHRTKQIDKAKQLLEEFVAAEGKESWDRRFVAAQSYQLLGENAKALREAEAATKLQPDNVASRLLMAKLLMSVDVPRAIKEFRLILGLSGDHGEARRQLAILLSASGNEADWREAMEMLETNADNSATVEGVADNRLRAALLSRQGKNQDERATNLTAARRILEDLIEKRGAAADDIDRLLLAKICEQEAGLVDELSLLQAAREQLQYLANRVGAPTNYTLEYTNFLLRQLARSMDSEQWTVMRQVFSEDAKSRIADMEQENQQEEMTVDVLQILGCRVRLQHATGQDDAAAKAIAEFVAKGLPALEGKIGQVRAWIAVANLYSSIGQHAEAEDWYRRLVKIAPESYVLLASELVAQGRTDDAIEACLAASSASDGASPHAATVLAQLMASASLNSASTSRVEPVISAALKSHGDDVDLLMAVAVFNVTRQNDAEAIRYFRRVVELAPTNALALNNLATLLAEKPDQRAEAIALVNRAIDASGRQPALLDTLGTIQIRSGQFAQAVASLEEAVAGGDGDPRYYFHLAAAYQRVQKMDQAKKALGRARQLGLAKTILTHGDQELLQELEEQFGASDSPPRLESRTRGSWPKVLDTQKFSPFAMA